MNLTQRARAYLISIEQAHSFGEAAAFLRHDDDDRFPPF